MSLLALEQNFRERGSELALLTPEPVTFAELARRSRERARQFAGYRRVALALPNGPEYIEVLLGLMWAGVTAAPLNGALPEAALAEEVERLQADVLLRPGMTLEPRGPERIPEADDPAVFLHTSGTTSLPKGVALTHRAIQASIEHIGATYRLTPADRSLLVMPLFHVHGLLAGLLAPLAAGGSVSVQQPRFSASQFWKEAPGCTYYTAVPTIHQILLARADADGALRGAFRFIRSSSSSLAPDLLAQLEARFEAPLIEAYGMTEACHQMTSNPLPPGERRAGSVGLPTGTEVAILDEHGHPTELGEACVRGDNVIRSYWENPEADRRSFFGDWFRTGDQGRLTAGGYLELTGRLKELINRGGEKLSPLKIDAVLLGHPAVAQAVSFGVPDPKYGEEVYAAAVLRGPAEPEAILDWARERLAPFEVPRRLVVVEELPKTATGKVQRLQMARLLGLG